MPNPLKSPQTLSLFSDKLFYKIGEVSNIVNLESYVLRYWETEFPFLSPRKSKTGQRIYTKKDIDLILRIKQLLYEDGYTIDGVRRKLGTTLKQNDDLNGSLIKPDPATMIKTVKARLRELLDKLE